MIGNISKSKGFKGDRGPQGEQGPQGPRGKQGVKGDTPALVLYYDKETGNLYYSSDGILVDKEYVSSNNLVARDEINELTQFVINLDASFAGDKTYDEIVTAYNEGKEIIGFMVDMNITFRFSVTACTAEGVQLMTQMANLILTISCTTDNVWTLQPMQLVTDTQLNNTLESTINNKISGFEKTENKVIQITANSTSVQYPTAKAVYNLVNTTRYDLQTQIDALNESSADELERHNAQQQQILNLAYDVEALKSVAQPVRSFVNLLGGADNWTAEDVTDDSGNKIGSRYGQVVNVNNAVITSNSKVDLQITSEQMVVFHEKDLAFVAENDGGVVTIYCIGSIPQHNYTIQAVVTEVAISE